MRKHLQPHLQELHFQHHPAGVEPAGHVKPLPQLAPVLSAVGDTADRDGSPQAFRKDNQSSSNQKPLSMANMLQLHLYEGGDAHAMKEASASIPPISWQQSVHAMPCFFRPFSALCARYGSCRRVIILTSTFCVRVASLWHKTLFTPAVLFHTKASLLCLPLIFKCQTAAPKHQPRGSRRLSTCLLSARYQKCV